MIMGRKPNTEQRRGQIVEALRAEMAEIGYERASIKSIAARAGLAPGLLHYHFPSKEAILLELVEALICQADNRYEELASPQATPVELLGTFVKARVGLGGKPEDEQVRTWVNLMAEAVNQDVVKERVAAWLSGSLEELAANFRAANVKHPEAKAAMLVSMILGAFQLHALSVEGVPRGYAAEEIGSWLRQVCATG